MGGSCRPALYTKVSLPSSSATLLEAVAAAIWTGYTKTSRARQNHARRSQTFFCPFLSASLTPGTPDTSQSVPSVKYTNKKIWCRLAQSVPKNSWKRLVQEARQKQQFFVWLRLAPSGSVWLPLAWFCLARQTRRARKNRNTDLPQPRRLP